MSEAALLQNFQLVAAILFGIGLVGFLVRRNMILMFLCVELMLQGVALSHQRAPRRARTAPG